MKMILIIGLIGMTISSTLAAKACSTHPTTGQCTDMITGRCTAGAHVSYSGCNFLEMCCYWPEGQPTQSPVTPNPGATCGVPDYNSGTKIVGGYQTPIEKYPWQVSIQWYNSHMCGGTLISDRWVLTAAHCFVGLPGGQIRTSQFSVVVGSTDSVNFYSYRHKYQVEEILTHSGFKENEKDDIALIKLSKAVDLTSKQTKAICLPRRREEFTGQVCVATGWGATIEMNPDGTEPGSVARLREVNIPIISRSLCQYYMGRFNAGFICAGHKVGGKDTCQGDSGGPLVCKDSNGVWKQAGIVSNGVGCARANMYAFYTEVSYYLDWIESVQKQYA